MRKFATNEVKTIKSAERVEELYIDNVGQIEAFEKELEGTTYLTEFKTLLTYVEYVANGNKLPAKKLEMLKGENTSVTEYEFKSKHIRLYAIQLPGKKLIVFMGTKKKADSSDNIKAFRLLTKQFLESQNLHK